jgi:hypothetical protein
MSFYLIVILLWLLTVTMTAGIAMVMAVPAD